MQITLDDESLVRLIHQTLPIDQFPLLFRQPGEQIQCEELGNRPPIQVVGLPVDDVAEGLLPFVVAHHEIVGLCMMLAHHADPSTHAALDHQLHRPVCDEVENDARLLQHRIPRHLGCGDIVCGVKLESPLFHSHRSEFLEHVGEDEHVDYSTGDTPLLKF